MVKQEKSFRGIFTERHVKGSKAKGAPPLDYKEGAIKMYHCAKCNKMFTKKFTYERHVRQLHLGIYSHVCQVCGKGFSHSAGLKGHLVSHGGVPEFKCIECGKLYRYKQDLMHHLEKSHYR